MGFVTTTLLVAAAAAGIGTSIYQGVKAADRKPSTPSLPKTPTTEDAEAATKASAEVAERRRRMARSQTVFTSPLGLAGEASVVRKTLLGQ